MKNCLIFLFSIISAWTTAQSIDTTAIHDRLIDLGQITDTVFPEYDKLQEAIGDAEIVMLGEQSHMDGTTLEMKVKMIKFLHREMDFDILAFESGFYDVRLAGELIEKGERPDLMYAKSIHGLWSESKEFMPLVDYIGLHKDSAQPLEVMGFDNQFTGKLSGEYFIKDIENFLLEVDSTLIQEDEWSHFRETVRLIMDYDISGLETHVTAKDTVYIHTLTRKINAHPKHQETAFWVQQLNNIKMLLMDMRFGDLGARDKQMAKNLIWIRENNPGKKIICWGATSHFLYNSHAIKMIDPDAVKMIGTYYEDVPSMGNYIKEKYGSDVYTIGFLAYQGEYGVAKKIEIETPESNALAFYIGLSGLDNVLLPLNGLELSPLISRPLSHQYMSTDIATVMDAVIFNRNMVPPKANMPLVRAAHPEYYWLEPDRKKRKAAKKKVKAARRKAKSK